jgi:Tfp pilus assembly protein PilF
MLLPSSEAVRPVLKAAARVALPAAALLLAGGCISQARQDRAHGQTRLGSAYLQEGDAPGAVAALEEAVSQDRRNWNAWNKLALAYLAVGAAEKSEDAFLHAIKLVPESGEANNNYGYMLTRVGRYAEAGTYYEIATRDLTYRKTALIYSNWGHALYLDGKYEESIQHLNAAVQRAPNLCQARFNRGLALEANGDKKRALDDFEAVINLCGDSASGAYFQAGRVLLDQGDRPGACTYFQTVIQDAGATSLGEAAADLHAREC